MADELKNPVRRSVIGEIISIKEINKDDFKEGKFRHDCRIVRVDPLNGAPLIDVYITNDQYDKYGLNAIIFAGNVVNFSIDENIVRPVISTLIPRNGRIIQRHSTALQVLTMLVA